MISVVALLFLIWQRIDRGKRSLKNLALVALLLTAAIVTIDVLVYVGNLVKSEAIGKLFYKYKALGFAETLINAGGVAATVWFLFRRDGRQSRALWAWIGTGAIAISALYTLKMIASPSNDQSIWGLRVANDDVHGRPAGCRGTRLVRRCDRCSLDWLHALDDDARTRVGTGGYGAQHLWKGSSVATLPDRRWLLADDSQHQGAISWTGQNTRLVASADGFDHRRDHDLRRLRILESAGRQPRTGPSTFRWHHDGDRAAHRLRNVLCRRQDARSRRKRWLRSSPRGAEKRRIGAVGGGLGNGSIALRIRRAPQLVLFRLARSRRR